MPSGSCSPEQPEEVLREQIAQCSPVGAYMAANAVATFALSVISTNLAVSEAAHDSTLDHQIELQTFWAPFFLLHLGGPDTITAFEMEDNNLWLRHMQVLVGQIGLTLYILFKTWRHSHLRALSAMMFTAGSIKYAERTWSLWSESYMKRRKKAEKALKQYYCNLDRDSVVHRDPTSIKLARTTIEMFQDTEGMFANVYVMRDEEYKEIVQKNGSPEVMRLIETELEMMYDNLYTKARVILSYTGLTLRFISFLFTCIILILFSSSEQRQHFHGITEYSLTFLLFVVAIGLELYATFVFLTLYKTISWFKEKGMDGIVRILENLDKLRTWTWSNSMGQFNEISYFIKYDSGWTQLMRMIFPRSLVMWLLVYDHPVPEQLKEFILEYLREASKNADKYSQQHLLFVQGKGRVPWNKYVREEFHFHLKDRHLHHEHNMIDQMTP